MPRLVECVPNVSEGRRGDVIDRLADAIRATDGVRLLDRTSDVDHNRSVFTYAGEPDAVMHATHALIDLAYREVDMNTHKGEHPRLGAVDVVPFFPLAGVTMEE
jgi:glutamate formiminotransferase